MKLTWCAILVLVISNAALAATPSPKGVGKYHLADAAADACLASCAGQNASCKRVCPATFSTPCLNICDSQAQACQQSCQRR